MPKIYIANTKPQNHLLYFRVPLIWDVNDKATSWGELKTQEIPKGHQVALMQGHNFTDRECATLIAHYGLYGMVRSGESVKGFRGLIYSIDRPVEAVNIQESLAQNELAAAARSDKILAQTAAANLDKQLKFAHETGTRAPQRAELEIVEQPRKGEPAVAKGAEALADGVEPKRRKVA